MLVFWTLNTLLLAVLCVSDSKRSRVEALYALREERPLKGLLIEDSIEGEAPMPPLFYLGQWDVNVVPWTDPAADLLLHLERFNDSAKPDVVLFFGLEEVQQRMVRTSMALGPLRVIGTAEPGLVDRVVHWLNPVNRNETIIIARRKPLDDRLP